MQDLRVGDPFEESTQLGPLASADAVTSLDADVKKTVAAGARVLTGGHPLDRPGNFLCAHRADRHPQRFACL